MDKKAAQMPHEPLFSVSLRCKICPVLNCIALDGHRLSTPLGGCGIGYFIKTSLRKLPFYCTADAGLDLVVGLVKD